MKNLVFLVLLVLVFFSCQDKKKEARPHVENWTEREVTYALPDSLERGISYLSVYPQIYSESEKRIVNLTATISMRNTSTVDTLIIDKIDYYNTKGDCIRSYLQHSVYILPMETIQIIINHNDNIGGTGANVIFEWKKRTELADPLFEAVMISTYGQIGLAFITSGIRTD